jgi:hypothetical protein
MPVYSGMSLTIGQPALIDVTRSTGKFPSFNVVNTQSSVTLSGRLINPSGSPVHTITSRTISNGNSITIPDTVAIVAGTYKMEFELVRSGTTFYDAFYFTAINNFSTYRSTTNAQHSNNANVANVHPDSRTTPFPALQLVNGRLVYYPDYKGNQIMDYSNAGYGGGGVAIPFVETVETVSPHSNPNTDMRTTIQAAINRVAARPLVNGFRGALFLEAGVYRVSGPLTVTTSGIVIRGAGPGTPTAPVQNASNRWETQMADKNAQAGVTKLIGTWQTGTFNSPDHSQGGSSSWSIESSRTIIQFTGTAPSHGSAINILDQYVGTGQRTLRLASVSGLQVGDFVRVQKATNADWVRTMYMDRIDGNSNWLNAAGTGPEFTLEPSEHTIAAINTSTNTITLADPLPDNLDMRWGTSTVRRITGDNRITNVGVENIQGISHFEGTLKPNASVFGLNFTAWNDERHPLVFVGMSNVRNGWFRNFVTYHFDRTIRTSGRSRNITVQDGYGCDPTSQMLAGGRRYTFYIEGQSSHVFMQRLYTRYSRHGFSLSSRLPGPNVFYDCYEEYPTNTSEPHFRWSTGGLFDNVTSRIAIQNRWEWGTSHGHSGVSYVMYNCIGGHQISQPQISPNWHIGHQYSSSGNRLGTGINANGSVAFGRSTSANLAAAGINGGRVPNLPPYQYSIGASGSPSSLVTPAKDNMPVSLYVQQLIDRTNNPNIEDILKINTVYPAASLPASTARGITAGSAADAPRAGDLAYGATVAGSSAVPRAVSGGDINSSRPTANAFLDNYGDTDFWQLVQATPAENTWLAVDYTATAAQAVTFDRVVVQARYEARPTSYNIEVRYPGSSAWTVIFSEGGSGVSVPNGLASADNRGTEITFRVPITASQVRIRILTSTGANNNIQLRRLALYRRGDINGSGSIDAADITLLRAYIAAQDKAAFLAANPAFSTANADVNSDGFINSADITLLRRWLAAADKSTVPFGMRP